MSKKNKFLYLNKQKKYCFLKKKSSIKEIIVINLKILILINKISIIFSKKNIVKK